MLLLLSLCLAPPKTAHAQANYPAEANSFTKNPIAILLKEEIQAGLYQARRGSGFGGGFPKAEIVP